MVQKNFSYILNILNINQVAVFKLKARFSFVVVINK